jgi:CubicO group peptidase (beta-lactamase class C family)
MTINIVRTFLATTVCVAALSPTASAQSRAEKVDRTNQLFAEWSRPDSPGCAVGIIQDGDLIFDQGYGGANLDYDLPINSQSVFYIGSTSKQFAAASIALLALRGDISLDDEVSKYVPEIPTYEHPVTIRQLVHHTSGVRDYLALRSISGKSFEDFFDMAWSVGLIARQEALNFQPGSEFLYSNSGYLLMAEIVHRVTGKPLSVFGNENFFEPLEMTATHWGDDRHRVVRNRVTSYDKRGDGTYRRYLKNFHAMGDGNLLTSLEDLVKWDRMFYDTTEEWNPLVELMHTRGVLNDGDTLDYAFGLFAGEYRGRRTIHHGGAFLGFRTELIRFPDDRFTSIALCNFGSANPNLYAKQLADIWLFGDTAPVTNESPEPDVELDTPIELSRPALARFAGVYQNPESPMGDAIVALAETGLTLEIGGATFQLVPVAQDRFRSEGGPVDLRLQFDTEGDRNILRAGGGGLELVFEQSDIAPYAPAELESFVGTFYSGELDATFTVSQRGEQLYVNRPGSGEAILRPVAEDEFTATGWTMKFTRGEAGAVDGLVLDAGRVRGLKLVRR